jgi:hypothetical protein
MTTLEQLDDPAALRDVQREHDFIQRGCSAFPSDPDRKKNGG